MEKEKKERRENNEGWKRLFVLDNVYWWSISLYGIYVDKPNIKNRFKHERRVNRFEELNTTNGFIGTYSRLNMLCDSFFFKK